MSCARPRCPQAQPHRLSLSVTFHAVCPPASRNNTVSRETAGSSVRMILQVLLLAAALLTSGAVRAVSTPCPQHFLNGQAPALINPKLAPQTRELCYLGYAALHSGLTRTPLW